MFDPKIEVVPLGFGAFGAATCFFFEAPDLNGTAAAAHARRLPGCRVLEYKTDKPAIWVLRFASAGREFQIETNHHAANSGFFVNDRDCPMDILTGVLKHFRRLQPLEFGERRPFRLSAFLAVALLLLTVAATIAVTLLELRDRR